MNDYLDALQTARLKALDLAMKQRRHGDTLEQTLLVAEQFARFVLDGVTEQAA